jgi:acid phosphatase (class A)
MLDAIQPAAKRVVVRRLTALALAAATATITPSATASQAAPPPPPAAPSGYLSSGLDKLPFTLAPPPTADIDIERNQVLSAQLSADLYAREEAFSDAEAYLPDNLMTRFSLAAGETLTRARRPILSHMLFRIWKNLDAYSSDLKKLNSRKRPFVGDPTIQPCDLSYLQDSKTGSWSFSYPSGHSADGYVAALLLVDVMRDGPLDTIDRSGTILARGVRFGTNRMVCGVHYPSDVAAGQAFAKALYGAIAKTPDFIADLACAREEEAADRKGTLSKQVAYSPACWVLVDTYARESH